MTLIDRIKPDFLRSRNITTGPFRQMFNYSRIWQWALLLTSIVTLVPLVLITAIDYNVTQQSIESENLLRTLRVGSNTKRAISSFLSERLADLVVREIFPHVTHALDIHGATANDIQSDQEEGGIGVAVSDRPEGPFADAIGKPLIDRFHNGAQPIDPFVFRDDDGQHYLYYGGWRHCNVVRLASDLRSIVPFPDGEMFKEITPASYVEGPFVFRNRTNEVQLLP